MNHLQNYTQPIFQARLCSWRHISCTCSWLATAAASDSPAHHAQRFIVRIIFMVPVYAVSSFLSLIFPHDAIYFDTVRIWCALPHSPAYHLYGVTSLRASLYPKVRPARGKAVVYPNVRPARGHAVASWMQPSTQLKSSE